MTKFDVFGIGNALMDILIKIDDDHLVEFDLKKGRSHLFEREEFEKMLKKLEEREHKLIPAGGTTNTIMGLANLGAQCVLCGKIGRDKHGDYYEDVIVKDDIKCNLVRCDKHGTGRIINLMTPDAERTFAVNLGASINLEKEEVINEDIKESQVFYFTGYEFSSFREIVNHCLFIAKQNGVKVAFDLADPGIVSKNLNDIKELLKSVDIVFMNESEAEALTGLIAEEAVKKIGEEVKVVVVKVGKEGSFVYGGGSVIKIEPYLKEAVDTTGAGDLYAAGFLYGILKGKSLELCGKYGSYMSSKVVGVIGGRLDCCVKKEVDSLV
ncbi:MAG: adenosine kinase [Nanoarchaeota archaeon]|nr:adenosine kinase [Nanoarchaeota archaeon]